MNRKLPALIALGVLVACAGNGAVLPPPSTTSIAARPEHVAQKATARLTIRVPRKRGRHAHYVSPKTASLAYAIDGGPAAIVNLAASNPDCLASRSSGDLTCNFVFNLTTGPHYFSFTTFDGANGTGKVLSANTAFPYTIRAGAANLVPVTLGGLAQSFAVFPASKTATSIFGSQGAGFQIYGSTPIALDIVTVDADGDYMVGPGAPQPAIPNAPVDVSLSTPPPSAPNTWTLTSTSPANDPLTPTASALKIQASPVPNSGGEPVAANVSLALYQPWIYVTQAGKISVFDERGGAHTPTGGFAGVAGADAIAYDSQQGIVFVSEYGPSTVAMYDVEGNPLGCGGCFTGVSNPYAIAYNPSNGWLYVVNQGGTIHAYFHNGSAESFSLTGAGEPGALTYDSGDGLMYLTTDGAAAAAYAFFENGGSVIGLDNGISNAYNATDITYDPHNQLLYIAQLSISAFTAVGDQVALSGTFPGLDYPESLAYDPYDGLLYVTNLNGTITAYDEQGNEVALPTPIANLADPLGIAVVP